MRPDASRHQAGRSRTGGDVCPGQQVGVEHLRFEPQVGAAIGEHRAFSGRVDQGDYHPRLLACGHLEMRQHPGCSQGLHGGLPELVIADYGHEVDLCASTSHGDRQVCSRPARSDEDPGGRVAAPIERAERAHDDVDHDIPEDDDHGRLDRARHSLCGLARRVLTGHVLTRHVSNRHALRTVAAPAGQFPVASLTGVPAGGEPTPEEPEEFVDWASVDWASFDWAGLRRAADAAAAHAYAPYSGLRAGAAGLCQDGHLVSACNVENVSYGLTLCCECGLVSALVAGGHGRLVAVSVTAGDGLPLSPCGRCRQLLMEHGGPELLVDRGPVPRRNASANCSRALSAAVSW